MATNIFTKAKAYRKKHPNTKWADCVKAVAVKKKVTGVRKKAAAKKAAPVKKVKVKVKKGGTITVSGNPKNDALIKKEAANYGLRLTKGYDTAVRVHGIAGISLDKVKTELQHQGALKIAIDKYGVLLKAKGIKPAEKAAIRREIAKYKNALSSSKKHVSALKRSI